MKYVTKSISLIVSIVMVFLLGYVYLPLTTNAFTVSDTDLTLEFNSSTGIADVSTVDVFTASNGELEGIPKNGYGYKSDPEDSSNTVFHAFNRVSNGYSILLGTNESNYDMSNAFVLKPSTTYTVSIKYKYEKGSGVVVYNADKTGFTNNLQFHVYTGIQANYDASKPKTHIITTGRMNIDNLPSECVMNMPAATNMDYNAETNSDVPPTYSRKVLAKDSEWMTAEFTFTTAESVSGNENLILALSAGDASINGDGWTQTDVNQYVGVYFDDITVVSVGNNTQAGEYVYDFVDKGVSCYEGAHHYWFSNSDNDVYNEGKYASYIAEEGMYLTTAVPGTMSENAQWIHRAAIRDTDINLGGDRGFFKVEAGTKYTVLMKYKTINIESTQARIGIGLSAPGGYAYDVLELGKTQHMVIGLERATHTNATDEWQYISVEIDGDGTSPCGSTNAGAYVYICATSDGYVPSTFLIESVKVCAVNKGSDSVIITKKRQRQDL